MYLLLLLVSLDNSYEPVSPTKRDPLVAILLVIDVPIGPVEPVAPVAP
jgi:hypothetical protein